ncbi:MAG: phosphate ABC transporter substrate-binding protein PstS [Rhodopila sp.]|jgi:phosphate transport system substrate-binding protein
MNLRPIRLALHGGVALVASTLAAMPARSTEIVLNETGSTLLYPLFERWVPAYTAPRPGVKINITATNSGEGIQSAIAGTVQIGTSDAYMPDEEAEHNRQIISIPLAISAQTVNCNIPGLNGAALQLDGPTLAGIYSGKIRQWDDPSIVGLNPGLKLPDHEIVPVRREDPSGDTFVFTQFLDFSTQRWEDTVGYGTTISWPAVPGEVGATGNDGMVKTIAATPYSLGYVGISFSGDASKAGLITVLLKNQNGKFVLPTAETVGEAASALDPRTPPNERLSHPVRQILGAGQSLIDARLVATERPTALKHQANLLVVGRWPRRWSRTVHRAISLEGAPAAAGFSAMAISKDHILRQPTPHVMQRPTTQ